VKIKAQSIRIYRIQQRQLKRKVYSHESIYYKKQRFQINNLMVHLKLLEKQEQAKSKTNRRGEITKIRAKINEVETKNNIQLINETKSSFFEKKQY
jgi:hypothetical protein